MTASLRMYGEDPFRVLRGGTGRSLPSRAQAGVRPPRLSLRARK